MKFHTIDDAILPALIDAFFYAAVNVRFEAEHIEYINADRKQQAAIFRNSYASIKKKQLRSHRSALQSAPLHNMHKRQVFNSIHHTIHMDSLHNETDYNAVYTIF